MSTSAVQPAALVFKPSEILNLKKDAHFNESWLENTIFEHPEILRLGNIKIIARQKRQKDGIARVDLIAQSDSNEVFVIELMLGLPDSSHIVRTLEYWLREKRRYATKSEVDVKAVLVAEQICESRYKDVVGFLCEKMPLIVKEVACVRIDQIVTLHCTTVFDSTDDAQEDPSQPPVSKETWEQQYPFTFEASKFVLEQVHLAEPTAKLKLNRKTTSISTGNTDEICARLRPASNGHSYVRVWVSDAQTWRDRLKAEGLALSGSQDAEDWVRFLLPFGALTKHAALLRDIAVSAVEYQREE